MRKIYTGILLLFASSMTLWAERVSEEDAALVANNFMNVRPAASAGVLQAPSAKRMVRKSTNNAEENLYYVYENENGEGWVIIAADDVVRPVLAYSETGHFRTDNMPSNLRKWMGKYNRFIARLEADSVVAGEETQAQWRALRKSPRSAQVTHTPVVGPLIETKWDQDAPFNYLCPGTGSNKAATGCVATAMAQVMKYWEWPAHGTGEHAYRPMDVNNPTRYSTRYTDTLYADFENTYYDWENMKNSYQYSSTSTQKTAVATLMYHCGVATEMMYGNDNDGGSGTYTLNYSDWDDPQCAQNAFVTYFGYKEPIGYMRDGLSAYGKTYYKRWRDADWTAMIKAELDKERPILYGGASEEGGHSFICDGYDAEGYFHFNWGWSGENDGYFLLSSLTPGSGGTGGGNYDFSEEQDVLIGIEPDRTQAIENTVVSEKATKILKDGQVMIIRGEGIYNLMGQKIN